MSRTVGVVLVAVALWVACAAPAGAVTITEYRVADGSEPQEIVAGPDGALWFTEPGLRRIGRIAIDGRVSAFALPEPNGAPRAIAAGPDALFYTDNLASQVGRLELDGRAQEVSTQTCAPTCSTGVRSPEHIAVAPDGRPWFSVLIIVTSAASPARDEAYQEICSLGSNLEPGECTKVDRAGVPGGHASRGPTLGPDDGMRFTNKSEHIVGRIPSSGPREIRKYPLDRGIDPFQLTAGPDGAIWFTELSVARITRVTTDGRVGSFSLPRGGTSLWGITAGPDGAVWFTESNAAGNAIGRITPGGVIAEFPLPNPDSGPGGIATGPDGALWFTERNGDRIGRLLPDSARPPKGGGTATRPTGPGRVLGIEPRRLTVPLRNRRDLAIRLDLARRLKVAARLQPAAGTRRGALSRVSRKLAAGRHTLRLPLPRGLRAGKLQVVVELLEGGRVASRVTVPVVARRRR